MADRKVTLTVEGKVIVDADVTKAREKIGALGGGTVGSGAPIPPHAGPATIGSGAPHTHEPPANPLQSASASYFNQLAERGYHSVASRMESARTPSDFRELGERIERATYNANQAGNKELIQNITALTAELKRVEEESRRTRQQHAQPWTMTPAGDAQGGGLNGGNTGWNMWRQQAGNWMRGQAQGGVGQALSGVLGNGLAGQIASGASRFLTGPLGLAIGGISAANWAFNSVSSAVTNANAPARNEIEGYADLARQYGSDKDFLGLFRDPNGWTNSRFAKLGYTATEAGHIASIYDRPGGMMNDTESILAFSRTTGTESSRTAAIANMIGRAGVGGLQGGHADDTLRVLKLAMQEGIKSGIAQSETLNSISGAVQKNSARGQSTNDTALAYFASIQARLNATGVNGANTNPLLRGEAGMNAMQTFMQNLGKGGGDAGLQFSLIQGLIDNGLPSAMSAGMSVKGADGKSWLTDEGRAYEGLKGENPVEAARYLMDRAGSGKNPQVMAQMAKIIDKISGGSVYLKKMLYEQMGVSQEQAMSMIGGGGAESFLGNQANGFVLGGADGSQIQKYKTGASTTSDVQGNNPIANQSMYLRVAEQDRDMINSLVNLNLSKGLEGVLSGFKNWLTDMKGSLFGVPTQTGSMKGSVGQGWNNPSSYTAPVKTAVNGEVTDAVGQPRIGAGIDGNAQATSRTLSAVAMTESSNGKDPNMNAQSITVKGKTIPKSAAGLFQMQSKWLPGENGWAKEAGVSMTLNGKPVTTTEQAREWQIKNPIEANKIAVSRLAKIEQQVRAQAKKDGVTLTNDQVAGYVGLIWHANGGASISPVLRNGKIITNPKLLQKNDRGDTVDDYNYYNRVIGAYSNPNLPEAATGFGTGDPNSSAGKAAQAGVIVGQKAVQGGLGMTDYRRGKPFGQEYGEWVTNKDGQKVWKSWGNHVGEDFFAPKNTPVKALFSGYASIRKDSSQGNIIDLFDKVNQRLSMIHLDHYDDGFLAMVKAGKGRAMVKQGQVLGYTGRTGEAAHARADGSNDHLHITAVVGGKIVDPFSVKWQGYRTGGYTGDHPQDAVAGFVHGQEFVMTADATRRFRPVLEAMNAGTGIGSQNININFGGSVVVEAALSPAAQQGIQSEYAAFQQRAAVIAKTDIENQRGVR